MKILLSLVILFLLGLIFYQFKYYSVNDYQVSQADNESQHKIDDYELNELGPISLYNEIIERPLFSLNRQPPAVKAQQIDVSVNIEELEELVIFGVVKSGDIGYAIIGNMDGEQDGKQVKVGFNYKGWRISEITSNSVKFSGDEVEYELSISSDEVKKTHATKAVGKTKPLSTRTHVNKLNTNTTKKQTTAKSSGGLIYNKSRNKSPIKIPRSNQLGNQEPLTDEELNQLQEEGGYSFDLDEAFDDEFYDE